MKFDYNATSSFCYYRDSYMNMSNIDVNRVKVIIIYDKLYSSFTTKFILIKDSRKYQYSFCTNYIIRKQLTKRSIIRLIQKELIQHKNIYVGLIEIEHEEIFSIGAVIYKCEFDLS